MKKIFLGMVLFLVWGNFMVAQEIDQKNVLQAAKNYMAIMSPRTQTNSIRQVYADAIGTPVKELSQAAKLHLIEYANGGWIMMTNDLSIYPVLAYSSKGFWDSDTNNMPPGLVGLLEDYYEQIEEIRMDMQRKQYVEDANKNREAWDGLQSLNSDFSKNLNTRVQAKGYTMNLLADDSRGGDPMWNQSYNENITAPAYNKFMPKAGELPSILCVPAPWKCDIHGKRKPVGCAPVAMGQLFRYWQFPPQYDWDKMPRALYDATDVRIVNNVAHLLKACAEAADVEYCCAGSWATTNELLEGVVSMGFADAKMKKRKDSDNGEGWPNRIKEQINQGYPVIYRGDKCDLCSTKHFWLITGYNADDEFYFNWGWGSDTEESPNGYYRLKKLKVDGDSYRKNNMVVYDIYPDWNVTTDSELRNLTKGNDEELRSFCRNATLGNITLKGNSQSKIAFTQTLTIDGSFEVSGDATLTLACYDKELAAQQSKAKTAPEDEEDVQDMRNEEPYTDEYSDLFHLAPNPATEEVQVSMMPEACGPEAKEVFVYGLNGGLWYQSQFSYSYGIVPLENLPSGMYLVRVVWEGYSVTKKLIVQ